MAARRPRSYNDGMMKTLAEVRVGPAGWSYEDWKGIVYPPRMPRACHRLTYIAGLFDTVEINTTFYQPPNPNYCVSWAAKVEDNPRFRFTAKLWQRFTHERDTWPSAAEAAQVTQGFQPLIECGRLGAVLIQFPWSFKRTPQNREWLARVIDTFGQFPLALEIRHASWDRPEVYEALGEREVAFCNIDQPQFSKSLPPTAKVTAKVGYVRLHGQNYQDWFRESAGRDDRYNYLYSEEELEPWLAKIGRMRQQAGQVYVVTNNHFRGQAVVNALELQHRLGKSGLAIPPQLLEAYPRLERLAVAE
jgi:uncharacterized protein YecE (DUF72 family)